MRAAFVLLLALGCRSQPPGFDDKVGTPSNDTGEPARDTDADVTIDTRPDDCTPADTDTTLPPVPGACASDTSWSYDTGPASEDLPETLADADFRTYGVKKDDQLGRVAAVACDLTGDGIDDLIVGAQNAGDQGQGLVQVFAGPLSDGVATVADAWATIVGVPYFDLAGLGVSCPGDIDGDGIDDLYVVSVESLFDADTKLGHVFLGPVLAGPTDVDQADIQLVVESNKKEVSTPGGGDYAASIALPGDITGDGVADLVLGDPMSLSDISTFGAVHILHGPVVDGIDVGTSDVLYSTGVGPGALGTNVASADLDGDGLAELAVSHPGGAYATFGAGQVFLLHGPLTGGGPIDDVATAVLTGDEVNEGVGSGLAAGQDVNGDGLADLAVSAPSYTYDPMPGAVYLYYHEIVGVIDAELAADACIQADVPGAETGYQLQLADIDGDGFGDVVMNANAYGYGPGNQGAAYVAFGPLNGHFGLEFSPRVEGENPQDGQSMSLGTGDFDADGKADVVVGSTYDDDKRGAVWVVDGWRW